MGAPDSVAVALVCDADIAAGTIGVVTVGGLDDARDNVFHLHLSREPRPGERIWLAYELNGLADHSAVARSFNHAPVFGGVIVGRSATWSHQREPLRREDVIMGRNTVQFATRDANRCAYRIRNVRLVVEPDGAEDRDVVIASAVGSADGTATYVGGFLTGAGSTAARLIIDGHEVPSVSGSFEWFEHDQKESRGRRAVAVQVIYPNGSEIQRTVHIERTAGTGLVLPFERVETCVATNVVPDLPFSLGLRGANVAADSATMAQALRVSITPLRAVDLAPLPADLVNVTGHGRGFRFLPDGTVFKKPVALSLAFDPALLPEGYTPADIRTYYFDEGVRSWKSVPLDTLLACDTLVRSFTTHFTDYINGIIQVPESPETMGYTPTSSRTSRPGMFRRALLR
ncbi:MAG: hypothetical protein IPO90_10520 [Flavobacteriales bacterium]|nr:hypothetical protein [Flavobacteriales bacterium]